MPGQLAQNISGVLLPGCFGAGGKASAGWRPENLHGELVSHGTLETLVARLAQIPRPMAASYFWGSWKVGSTATHIWQGCLGLPYLFLSDGSGVVGFIPEAL